MLQAELGELNTGADAMEQSTRRMMQILSEIARTAVVLQSCAEGDLQQPISELSGTLEQTAYLARCVFSAETGQEGEEVVFTTSQLKRIFFLSGEHTVKKRAG